MVEEPGPWLSAYPESQTLRIQAADILDRLRSIGMHREQASEARHAHYNQNMKKYPAGTKLYSAAKLMPTKTLAV